MSSLSRELVFLILQFLDEEKFKESVHKLEQESGFYFNMKHFEEEVQNGNWEEVEKYLSGFTKVDDNRYSMKIFFEIRKQKYLEALDKHDRGKGVEILVKDLKVFATFNEDLYKEITQLLTLENFRENEQLSKYGDTKSARSIMLVELKKLIEANPLFRDKLQFPNLKSSRLRTLINQSLNWQHQLCKNPRPNPDIKTLFVDHSCGQANGAHAPGPAAGNPLLGAMPKPGGGGFPPLGAHGPFQPPGGPVPAPLAGWMSNPSVSHPAVSGAPMGLGPPTNPGLNHPAVSGAIGLGAPSNPIPVSAGASPISLGGPTNPERQKRPSIKIYEHADNPAMPHLPPFNSYTFPSSTIAARLSLAPSSPSNNNAVGRPSPAPGPNNYVAWPSLAPGGPSNNNAARRPSPAPGGPSNNNGAMLKHPRPGTGFPTGEYPTGADSDHVAKRMRPIGVSEEVSLQVNMAPGNYAQSSHGQQVLYTPDDIPKTVARTLAQGSSPMSMDFHPTQQTILLVGTNVGDIGLWDVGTRDKLVLRNFKVWELAQCSMALQSALVKDPAVSVNRVIWSPDGSLFGVAYSKHVVQIYSYHGGGDIRQHLEIDAHTGGVNDIAFSHPNKQLCVITCGDDKTIKVWDATSGARQYIFEGHDAPVYSVCPHHKENIQFIFSTALDGKIKAWLYDNLGSRVDYDAPGHWCTTMAYSADGTRLFSCGTSKEGESYIVEWNESEGAVKRTYQGFRRKSLGVVQFDTTKNRFLAAGDEFGIKFWDMDNINILTTVDAEGGLSASPRIRFNKDGTLLAVSTSDNGIKILANADGVRLLRNFENQNRPFREQNTKPIVNPLVAAAAASASGPPNAAPTTVTPMILQNGGDIKGMVDIKPRITEDPADKAKLWKLTEISEPAQCRSLRLMDNLRTSKISRLIYTNSGVALLALASNAIHLLWKWPRNERNPTGKATAAVTPQLWQPPSGILMTNDITDTSPEEAVPSFALSKNDSYVMSASGGKISLFNMMTFKTMTTFMPPPPAATFLAFHPQDNNIIAIGMDDSTIQIYNVRVDEVKSKLKGHSKRITGLAFSNALNVLISSGADSQICVWSNDGWEKQRSKFLPTPQGSSSSSNNTSDTRVQFHHDQVNFLVVHETQIAIYETTKLECLKQWVPRENSAPPISHATFSCDSQLIYATFVDATVCIFTASNLKLRCRILPAAYLPQNISQNVHPLVVAAHPTEPNQFAIGLTDGGVHVIEPLESEGKWGAAPPAENGSSSSNATAAGQAGGSAPPGAASSSDQPQR